MTVEQREEIARAYAAGGVRLKDLASKYGVSDYSIRMIVRQAGVQRGHSRLSAGAIERVRELWLGGSSIAAIARAVELGETTVRIIVADLDR